MRQYISTQVPDKNGKIVITGKDYKYFTQVLRLRVCAGIEVRLPDDTIVQASIESIDSKSLMLSTLKTGKNIEKGVSASVVDESVKGKSPEIWLFQFIPKGHVMDDVVRHATECGVTRILPIVGAYSKSSDYSESKLTRWERIVKESRQQCGSPINTILDKPSDLTTALNLWNAKKEIGEYVSYVLYEMPGSSSQQVFKCKQKPKIVSLAVGCEGGMSKEEIDELVKNDFSVLHFNTNIMRVDTAALYGLAAVQYVMTEFESWHVQG